MLEGVSENSNEIDFTFMNCIWTSAPDEIKSILPSHISEMFTWEDRSCTLKPLHIRQSLGDDTCLCVIFCLDIYAYLMPVI